MHIGHNDNTRLSCSELWLQPMSTVFKRFFYNMRLFLYRRPHYALTVRLSVSLVTLQCDGKQKLCTQLKELAAGRAKCSVIFVLVYFFVLVSCQFYSIGDFYKYVMMHITSHQHILDILHQHIGDCHTWHWHVVINYWSLSISTQ